MTPETRARIYPESKAGGFSRFDGTIAFFTRINALLKETDVALDLGAGRGAFYYDETVPFRKNIQLLRGKCSRVIGLDVSDAVLTNPAVDESHVLSPDGKFPLGDSSVDLVLSDHTFEHVDDPIRFENEIARVLKSGGWVCARTPNLFGHISIMSRIIPSQLHQIILKHAQPDREVHDVFPTHYKMNSRRQLRYIFPEDRWDLACYTFESEPAYVGNSYIMNKIAEFILRRLPAKLASTMFVFAQKRP